MFDKSKMTKLCPGGYDDGKGGLHIDEAELLTAAGYADTPANRRTLREAMRDLAQTLNLTLTEVEDG
jgi:hypothetical protein